MTMGGTILIGAGTLGSSVVSRLAGKDPDTLTVDWKNADLALLPPGSDSRPGTAEEAEAAVRERENEVLLRLTGFTSVVLVISSGSMLGNLFLHLLSEISADRFTVTAVTAVPFRFEEEQRARAVRNLVRYGELADRVFIMDLQYSGFGDRVIGDAMQEVTAYMASVAGLIAGLKETIPFRSTFTER